MNNCKYTRNIISEAENEYEDKPFFMKEVIECPVCHKINNYHFVMYYGDSCFNCDYDIKGYLCNKSRIHELRRRIHILDREIESREFDSKNEFQIELLKMDIELYKMKEKLP